MSAEICDSEMAAFGVKIKEAADRVGGLDRLAELLKDVKRRTLTEYVADRSEPKISTLQAIADATGVEIGWLLSDLISNKAPSSEGAAVISPTSSLLPIPVYRDVRPSAGAGTVPASEHATSVMAFDQQWLRDLGVNPTYATILFAEGDSMYPTIPNGSPMLVDTSRKEIMNGCIYVFNVDGDLMVKRIERLLDGSIDLISDNKERYPTRNINRDRLAQMTIVGRVYSALRTF